MPQRVPTVLLLCLGGAAARALPGAALDPATDWHRELERVEETYSAGSKALERSWHGEKSDPGTGRDRTKPPTGWTTVQQKQVRDWRCHTQAPLIAGGVKPDTDFPDSSCALVKLSKCKTNWRGSKEVPDCQDEKCEDYFRVKLAKHGDEVTKTSKRCLITRCRPGSAPRKRQRRSRTWALSRSH